LHTDIRGSLFEAIKSPNGGQSFMSITHPGITRGNHYHTRKVERFLVTGGEAEIKLRHLFGNEVQTFRVTGEQPSYIDIPTLHTHNITNIGTSTLTTLFWTHELFDPASPDTVAEQVEPV
jgi:UDP-2-acetamido-2,6-beta-L-arabino-hexul-4-ose reductase